MLPREFIFLAAFLSQTIKIDNDIVKFDIWDTAGQEQYHALGPAYYRDAGRDQDYC